MQILLRNKCFYKKNGNVCNSSWFLGCFCWKIAIFSPRNGQKWPWMANIFNSLILFLHYPAYQVFSKLGCAYSLKLRIYELLYHLITIKMAIFNPKIATTKIALNGHNYHSFYIDPTLSCLKSIQLTQWPLFFRIKKLRADLLPKTLKMTLFH